MFFNPCRCECEKEIIRSELVVIVKQFSPTKRKSIPVIGNFNKLTTVAMEPKHMEVKRHNLFKEKEKFGILTESYEIENFQENYEPIKESINNDLKKSVDLATNNVQSTSKTLEINNSKEMLFSKESKNEKNLKEKIMNGNQSEDTTERKTFKKYNNPIKPKKEENLDIIQTTKRFKKKQSLNLLKSPNLQKNNLPQIDEIVKINLHDSCDKENQPIKAVNIENNSKMKKNQNESKETEKMIKLMNDEISMLKNELKRLEEDEKRLFIEKNQNEKFFQEDFSINEKKKENLKRNCQQRSEELRELKQLLVECRNRNA